MSHLPEWAINALAEAGVDAAGWMPQRSPEAVQWQCSWAYLHVERRIGEAPRHACVIIGTHESDWLSIPDAFRLADRLARALEGKPDARVGELEKEVARLIGAATQAANIAYNMSGVNLTDENRRRIVAILDPAISRAKSALSQPEREGGSEPTEPEGGA